MTEISKRLRFDTFKRDHFTCQYCGRTPPAVTLEVDHVIPVSAGGAGLEENLITSCFDCNRGKAANSLQQVPKALTELMEEKKRMAEQVRAYNRFLKSQREKAERAVESVGIYWFNQFKERKDQYVFGIGRTPTIRTFLKHLPVETILEAIDIAFERLPTHNDNDWRTFKYFCGVCWKKIKGTNNATNSPD